MRRRKIIIASALLALMVALFAVYMFRGIRYVNGKGNDYLVLSNRLITKHKVPDNLYVSEYLPEIAADSLSELILKIKLGNFTDLERRALVRRMQPDEQGRVVIPDLQNLIEIIPPKDMELQEVTLLRNGDYNYYYKSEDNLGFIAEIYTPVEDYGYQMYGMGKYKSNWSEWPTVSAFSTTKDIRSTIPLDDNLECKFQIHTDTMVFYVIDSYSYDYDSVPRDRYMYSELWDGQYLYIVTRTLTNDFSWLSEIDVQPYKG